LFFPAERLLGQPHQLVFQITAVQAFANQISVVDGDLLPRAHNELFG
jgi:hypothetical protein